MKKSYDDELEFEKDLIQLLTTSKGWSSGVLKNKTEKELIQNWADILFQNNRSIDRLGDYPLTSSEMDQILLQINNLRTPLKLNGFINGKTITIKRDNPADKDHLGKEISLKIYDRDEIAAGQSVYQIAEQPRFSKKSSYLPDRRGDFMLLINGMPLIHIELKKSGVPISQAQYQIQKYSQEGLFSGLFSLVQIFVAMNPEEMTYFANPGPDGKFNNKFFFHWEDFYNELENEWQKIADDFLSIPMAHQLIGFYTVADETDGKLKVMRSYQYYAANKISDAVTKLNREGWHITKTHRGGYIWHTTGSGKTMTSFKSAQLIANSKDADKVVFLMDRIELGTQSLNEYRGFAGNYIDVQSTESTDVLISKLKSKDPLDTLIVTSIQKMSRIKNDDPSIKTDLDKINKKRIVIIIDECHRSVFGDMLQTIQDTFYNAVIFGFTGTPIQEENQKKSSTTSTVFGNELHRYSIADGIRDKNVLPFDIYSVRTFTDDDIRKEVALYHSKASSEAEALADPRKKAIFYHYMDDVPMASADPEVKGIEDYIPSSQFDNDQHREMVCKHILNKWVVTSRNSKYHAIFATSSIPEACEYYKLFKKLINDPSGTYPHIKIACLFDEHDNNGPNSFQKELAIVEMLKDYESMYGLSFGISNYQDYKKDVSRRLAHKKPYSRLPENSPKQLDLLIVVDQMLTGYDSIWVNSLYLDKYLEYERIVQAFSRTNRINGDDKPFGIITYFRYVNKMAINIDEAFKLYSGDKPFGIFVDKLEKNLTEINMVFSSIDQLFKAAGISNFAKNPDSQADKEKFVLLFNNLNHLIEAAKIQGFRWHQLHYDFKHENSADTSVDLSFDEIVFETLLKRYKELFAPNGGGSSTPLPPYDVDPNLIATNARRIDYSYMKSNFKKYVKELQTNGPDANIVVELLNVLRSSFASLNQEDQKIANIIIHDIQAGSLIIKEDDEFDALLERYKSTTRSTNISKFCDMWGIPEGDFVNFLSQYTTINEINSFGRFDKLIAKIDKVKARQTASRRSGKNETTFQTMIILKEIIKKFLISECMELPN